MNNASALRVLDDYELDFVSGGLDEGSDYAADPFTIPEGFNAENISGVTLYQDATTGDWMAEFVFESTFSEAGYSSGGGTGGGEGEYPELVSGQSLYLGDGGGFALAAGGGGGRGTSTTRVTTTRTSPSATITINLFGLVTFTFTTGSTTTSTEKTTAGRVTSTGKVGQIPSK